MKDTPVISVIVCTYNRAGLLQGCLQSLVEQNLDKGMYEVIVIDNNSNDDTQGIAEEFAETHSNIRLVKEDIQGLGHARNRGCLEARGRYVAYIDDDAKAYRNWAREIAAFIDRRPEIAAFGGPYSAYSLISIPAWYKISYGEWSLGKEERQLAHNEWINGTNMIFRKSLLAESGGFNTNIGMSGGTISYGEETNLIHRLKERGIPVFYVPDIRVEHLIAKYKLSLGWMLSSCYKGGYAYLEALQLSKKPVRQSLITFYTMIYGLLKFPFIRERYFRTRIYECFRIFFWNLGLTVRMFKN